MSLIWHGRASDVVGSTMPDLSGGGLDGTLTAGCSVVTLPNGETAVAIPSIDAIEIADDPKWALNTFTYMIRFAPLDYINMAGCISQLQAGGGAVNKYIVLFRNVGGFPVFSLEGYAGGNFRVTSNPYQATYNMAATAWVTRDASGNVVFGINDAVIGTATLGPGALPNVAGLLRLGAGDGAAVVDPGYSVFTQVVAARIYDTDLSYADLQAAWLADAPAPLPAVGAGTQLARWRPYSTEMGNPTFPSRLSSVPDGFIGSLCSWITLDDCPAVLCEGDGVDPPPTVPPGLTSQARCITVTHDARWRLNDTDFALVWRGQCFEIVHTQGLAGHNEGTDGNNVYPMWAFYVDKPGAPTDEARLNITWVERNNANVRHTASAPSVIPDFVATGVWGLAVERSGDTFTFYAWDGITFLNLGSVIVAGAFPDDIVALLYIGRGGNQSRDDGDQDVASFRMFNYALGATAVEAVMVEDATCAPPAQAKARVLADCGDPIFVNACPDPDAP